MFDINTFDVQKFDKILSRGLSQGLGYTGGRVCIEAAICETLGLGLSDDPKCVSAAVRSFKIALNDSNWSSPENRAKGLRNLGLAQLGSLGVVNDKDFVDRLLEKTIRILIPDLFRKVFVDPVCLEAADRCEKDEDFTKAAANAAKAATIVAGAADAASAAYAHTNAAYAARTASETAAIVAGAADAAYATMATNAAYAANAASNTWGDTDYYLRMSAQFSLEILIELKSPGVGLLTGEV